MTYGLKIYGANGTSVVFDETHIFSRLSYKEKYILQPNTTKTVQWSEANKPEKYQILTCPLFSESAWGYEPEIKTYSTYFTLTSFQERLDGYLYILRRT